MPFFSAKANQFTYFSQQLGERLWQGKNVLDFGGNIGNILRDPNSTINEERYWCLDVVKESIDRGRALYPRSHWLFYDRYCFFFNPGGVVKLPLPDLGLNFDFIVGYSVFTNTPPSEMLEMVSQLTDRLSSGGALAFTFIDPFHWSWPAKYEGNNFQWRLEQEIVIGKEAGRELNIDIPQLVKKAEGSSWFMLVNGEDLYVETEEIGSYQPERQRTCHVFHTQAYMRSLLPQAEILAPANNEMQHCVVIRKQ
ncbi:MAG TPA: hypothetical protein VGJ66_16590 [Pyrinomonadaceae bacterium]